VRAVLVSRYPRVDTPEWKRRVAGGLVDAGVGLAVLYSSATLLDQARAGLREEGMGVLRRYLTLRESASAGELPTQSLAAWARERGIPVEGVSRLDDLAPLRRLAPDLLVLMGADIVPATVLGAPRLGTINAHYGLLPAYRGMNVTEWSVFRGDPVGVTVHLVDPGVDTGDILLQEEIPIAAGETFATIRRKHQDVAARLVVQAALQLRDGSARPVPQAPHEGRQYYRMHPALLRVAEARLRDQASGARGARSSSSRSAAAASTSPSATWASDQRR
jgi:folate-dependent phosphoribosylglycinamide formyltransferase PurN